MLGITGDVRAAELVKHIVDGDITAGLHTINSVTQEGVDLRQFARELVEYLRELLLVKADAPEAVDLPKEALAEMKELADRASMPQLSQAVRMFREVEMGFDGFSPLPLELAMVECALPSDRSALLDKLERATEPLEEKPAAKPTRPVKPVRPAAEKAPAKKEQPIEEPAAEVGSPPEKEEAVEEPVAEAEPTAEEDEAVEIPVSTAEPVAEAEPAEPTEVPVTTPSPASEPEPVGSDLEEVRRRWKDVVSATKGMGSRGNLDALLRSACEPVEVTNDTLVLGFYYDFHKEKIEDPKYRTMVEAKVQEVFGRNYKIRCKMTEKKAGKKSHIVDTALRMGATPIEEDEA